MKVKDLKETKVLCAKAKAEYDSMDDGIEVTEFDLPIGFSSDEFEDFIQYLTGILKSGMFDSIWGTIWMQDGSWVEVVEDYEYGAKYLRHVTIPQIPEDLYRE